MSERSPQDLERALEIARAERDRALFERDSALSELADARTELNRLRLRQVHQDEPLQGEWGGAGSEALPLRYRIADRLNAGARRFATPGHALVKRLLVKR